MKNIIKSLYLLLSMQINIVKRCLFYFTIFRGRVIGQQGGECRVIPTQQLNMICVFVKRMFKSYLDTEELFQKSSKSRTISIISPIVVQLFIQKIDNSSSYTILINISSTVNFGRLLFSFLPQFRSIYAQLVLSLPENSFG